MDEVVFVLVEPVDVVVVDFEEAVWWDPGWLDGAEIDAGDFGFGKTFGYFYAPDSSSCADVEDLLGVFDGAEVVATFQRQSPKVMAQVLLVLGFVVVGAPMLGGAV